MKKVDRLSKPLSVQLFTGALDALQQDGPLADDRRALAAVADLGNWLAGLSVEDVATIITQGRLLIDRWMPEADEYDALAVCAAAQFVIRDVALNTALTIVQLHDLVTGAGMYLSGVNEYELPYLSERAA